MNKKVLFYNPFTAWPFHFETDLEIIKNHVENHDEVIVLTCQRDLPVCEPNPSHTYFECQACMSRREKGFRMLGLKDKVKFRSFKNIKEDQIKVMAQYQNLDLKTIMDLKAVIYKNCDIGMAVAASLIDYLREAEPEVPKYMDFVNKAMNAALMVYFSMKNNIEELKPTIVYVFNGRLAALRPAMRAAQESGIALKVHERAGVYGKYSLTEGTYPHDWDIRKRSITDTWEKSLLNEEEKIRIGEQWYKDNRFSGRSKEMLGYKVEHKDILPENFDTNKFNVVVFSSSEEEFAAISGFEWRIYKNQNDGIQRIAEDLRGVSNLHVYLRVHPNLKTANNSQTRFIDSIKNVYPHMTVIDARSPVNSYKLLDASDLTVTFGSHLALEAVYAGKLSLLVRRTPFEDLGACVRINSHEELISIIKERCANPRTEPDQHKRELAAIKYGFFINMYGEPLKHFKQHNTHYLTYQGRTITPNFWFLRRVISRLHKIYHGLNFTSLRKT